MYSHLTTHPHPRLWTHLHRPAQPRLANPVPLTFEDANHEGGGRTVVPNTDAGTSIEEELDEEDDKASTVLHTKGLFDDALRRSRQ